MRLCRNRGPVNYVTNDERDEHGKPKTDAAVFVLRPDSRETQDLITKFSVSDDGLTMWDAARIAILDIEGCEEGSDPIERDGDGLITDETCESIPMAIRLEIATKFIEICGLTVSDRKN